MSSSLIHNVTVSLSATIPTQPDGNVVIQLASTYQIDSNFDAAEARQLLTNQLYAELIGLVSELDTPGAKQWLAAHHPKDKHPY